MTQHADGGQTVVQVDEFKGNKTATKINEHIVEIVSDSGEGAQKCGQTLGSVSGKMGNGVWTVEIIPAEIQPPARSPAGASGIRIRIGSDRVTNMGNEADLVVAFNEQVLYSRIADGAYKKGTIVLLENKWKSDPQEKIQEQYNKAISEFSEHGFIVHEVPMEMECLKIVSNARKGKNMFVLGMVCNIYNRDADLARSEIAATFAHKGEKVIKPNIDLFNSGYEYASNNFDYSWEIEPKALTGEEKVLVCNGNQAIGLGVMASGMDMVSMYPITPATSASHYIAAIYDQVGGFVHQAEDEIAAIGFAIGASYAGKTACTITSGPGMALKTEMIGLAVMSEIPLVIINVQRGGPSTGLPTKVEQADLLSSLYGMPGDAPKIIIAPATIEECFHFVIMARKLAETFRGPVIMLTDANLATGVQPWNRPELQEEWLAAPIDQSPWDPNVPAYDWDEETGLSQRPIPGQRNGMYVLTGLSHTSRSKVAYDSDTHQTSMHMRSRKLAALQKTLKKPEVHGDEQGDLLIVSWGSTMGAVQEAVDLHRAEGKSVSQLHLRFLSPMEPHLKEIFSNYKKVMTIEINYSDDLSHPLITEENRRLAQLAIILRAQTLVDIDCWSVVYGHPLQPGMLYNVISGKLAGLNN
ncbi:2-oxoacid:acceptor oxidoreductase subunit alpha [endosymbiont of Ridgeia piscesae]|jgi:2-oxoglutarate ferredoxin oxidoreductase subunit alpha|uniref:2-oxoacid:acceptor oxidoreductase, alpha subunit n=1 Tax=endosymbiont of Ridgeia piscesae TaxID=54398 RepID=A0A0T5YTV0_9GAMM|nr:2-oxoacid:acceptor oxidoreductase subunit alpha [endosymbiont of Ridgeia piscesae]KRT54083.1 2-oxoacid:acceptor oxidoreductase, alpha subunit [endosymbiont of Ridgeia piscesae]KRT60281.1 2-oxoglutarate ferredoxin oxidoreductase subunit alpha [endosymbiont of Ridgeia piscesae]